ncbi:uncharacterized protein NPIL_648341, partial [Nephila pilipes]
STKIKSEARELVESFPITNENYHLAIESLTERYGRKELLIDFYVRELLKLVLNNATKKKQDSLSSLYNKLSTQLRALSSLGVTTDQCGVILYPLVESSLPTHILRSFEGQRKNIDSEQSISTLDAIVSFLKSEVQSEEKIKLSRSEILPYERECKHLAESQSRNITSSSNSTLDADVSNNDIKTDIKNPCAKERKIPDLNASFSTFEGNIGVINAIMNLNILSFVFKNDVRCKKCDNGMDMQVLKNNSGLAISFVLKCCVCPYRVEFSSSDYHEGTQRATVNTRYVYAMRSIGRGAEAGRMFCALMNLPQPPTRFAPYNKRLLNAVKLVSEETMQKATQEAVLENGSNNNIAVAVDGTWQKRVQKECYSNEETRKNLRGLQVFEDEEGILRLKSRLINEEESKYFISPIILPSKHLADIPLNNVSDLDQIEKTNIVLRWNYIQKVRENLKQGFKREYLGFLRSSVTKREDKINVGDIVLIGTDDKKRLHWLLGRVLELFPGKDGIIRLVKLRTEKGEVLRPIQRLYPLELKPNYEQVVSENRKGPEVVTEYPELNTNSNKTVPVTSSGREIKPVKRLDL